MSYISRLFKRITNRDDLSQLSNNNGSNNNKSAETRRISSNQDNLFITYNRRTSYQPVDNYFHKNKSRGFASIYLDDYNQRPVKNTLFGRTDIPCDIKTFNLENKSIIELDQRDFTSQTASAFVLPLVNYIFPMPSAELHKISDKTVPQKTDITKAGEYGKKNNIREITLPDGTVVLGHSYSHFNQCQEEWLDLQKYMVQAANELGLTLVYSDVCRTVSTSNKSRANKGNHVAPGGNSPHNYGVAADIILLKNGKRIKEKPNKHEEDLQAKFAQRVSELSGGKIAWGGDKKYYPTLYKKERHHFELRDWNKKDSENYCKDRDHLINRLA